MQTGRPPAEITENQLPAWELRGIPQNDRRSKDASTAASIRANYATLLGMTLFGAK